MLSSYFRSLGPSTLLLWGFFFPFGGNINKHVALTRRVQRPRGCSSQQWTLISVQFVSPAVEASLGRLSSSSDTVPDGDSRLTERSPRHTALMSTLTWGGIKEGSKVCVKRLEAWSQDMGAQRQISHPPGLIFCNI